ncbi:3-hydroxyacyl-ACP dehydratase FabZ family protein [Pseudobacteriovorax antillogorgiicola]|uniref:3-hydroxyacyl-[acyl-carrier-protein] dehydratase n=1 Tax=Pseudobacteriovorax antillogorgiicola TaxID=1513793 RepID=A0A1Y6BBF6_9BACT|nr:beta-hydroxyacyl-ACP dehydratase [Pseudobacteriovorax antillogorgiicola]TCS58679.1 3-hydroxyacyl-[acyl-carrier-protein] dehydratase [Pseudobacteriovorax antillogorgiicola]SME95949.1 3-hydroxyacyl-[acyl-carrier-protein] dehydratase [Pseudobacteriovorax antillogorgiicola]
MELPNSLPELSEKILSHLPQQEPFRFVDQLTHIDEDEIHGQYRFKNDEYFYRGHFPHHPVTPGVILTEAMAQIGVCSLSIYLMLRKGNDLSQALTTLFTESNVEFLAAVEPGELITVKAKKVFWRRGKLKCQCDLFKENGQLAAQGTLAGIGV